MTDANERGAVPSLKIMSWNVQGINTKLNQPDFIKFCNMFDIFACSEIFNCSKDLLEKIFYRYNVYVSYRTEFYGGGIAVFVLKSLQEVIKEIPIDLDECIVLLLDEHYLNVGKSFICCFPYVPHEYSSVLCGHLFKGIDRLIEVYDNLYSKFGDAYWVIGGDMNARTGNLHDFIQLNNLHHYLDEASGIDEIFDDSICEPRNTRDPYFINNYGRQLTDFCKINNLCILNGRTDGDREGHITCIANKGKSIVDYFIISKKAFQFVSSFTIIPRTESDHFPLVTTLSGFCTANESLTDPVYLNSCFTLINPLTWNFHLSNNYLHEMNICLNEIYEKFMSCINSKDIDTANNILNECIKKSSDCMQNNYNHKNVKASLQPKWWDKNLASLKRDKYMYLHIFHLSNDTYDLEMYLQSKRLFKNMCSVKRNEYDKKIVLDLVEKASDKNSKSFWHLFKSMTTTHVTVQPKISVDNWFEHFKHLYNNFPVDNMPVQDDIDISMTNDQSDESLQLIFNTPITYDEVDKAINNSKSGKACGSDGIGPEFYKVDCNLLKFYLHALFNKIYELNFYPAEWSKSLIHPLHKKGSVTNVENYRGISLLNITSKMFSGIIFERLIHYCDIKDLLPESQAGGRRGYSTIDNIFCLQSLVQKYLSKKSGRFYILFVDFSKAYDSVNRSRLWEILIENGLKGKILDILQAMHQDVLAAVKFDRNKITDYFKCMNGVKQGCVLSTLLFSMYLSKLESIFISQGVPGIQILPNDVSVFMLMYIDDICIFSDNPIDLQKKLNILDNYCRDWGLKINTNKTKIIVFRNGGIIKHNEKWFYKGEKLENVTYYSYLGILISSRLCWSKCVENLSFKALQIISQLRYLSIRYDYLTSKLLFKLFDSKVKPIILYGSEIWGVKKYDCIENVHIKFCKLVLNVGKTTMNFAALSECGRYPMFVYYHHRAIKYWCKLLEEKHNRYIKKCYTLLHQLDESGRHNWASDLRILICSLGYGHVWYQQSVGDVKYFLIEVKQRLIDISRQEWHAKAVHQCPEYLNYHPYPFIAPHTELVQSYKERRIYSLLRTFSLPLKNNLLRLGIRNNNLCEKCSGIYVENEYHFLFRCSAYTEYRETYIPERFRIQPSIQKLNQLLQTKDLNTICSVIRFILRSKIVSI